MSIFKRKAQFKIVMIIILAMLIQVAVPTVSSFAFAEGDGIEESSELPDSQESPNLEDSGNSDDGSGEEGQSKPEEVPGDGETDGTELDGEGGLLDDGGTTHGPIDNEDSETNIGPSEVKPEGLPDVSAMAEGPKDLGEIFTSVTLTVNEEVVDTGSIIQINDGTIVRLDYKWTIGDDVDLKAGDYATIQVPNVFAQFSVPTTGDLEWGNAIVGTFIIDEYNVLTATFNNELADKANRHGTAWMSLEFNLEEFNDNTQQTIDFNTEKVKTFKITAKPGGNNSVVEKSGKANTVMNATSITWTVDINKTMDIVKGAMIEDTLTAGLELDDGGIKIYRLTIGMDGEVKDVSQVVKTEAGFPVELGDIDSAYRIVYTSNITDNTQESFTNNVNLTGTNDVTSTDTDTVLTPKGSLIDKYNGTPDKDLNPEKISWTIDVNKAESSITNARVTDNLPEGLEVIPKTIKVYHLSFNSAGDPVKGTKVNSENIKIDYYEFNDFIIELGDIDSAYRIEYDTKIIYGIYEAEKTYVNQVTLTGENITDSNDSGEATIKRGSLINKSGTATVDHEIKKITWTIDVNQASNKINSAIVTDTISGLGTDLELDFDSIMIYDHNNQIVYSKDKTDDYTVTKTGTGFTVNFGDITTAYKIVYDTTIKNYNQTNFVNTAGIGGTGGVGEEISTDVTPDVNPTITNYYEKSTISSGTYNGITYDDRSYAEKTMSWNIKVRPVKAPITSLTITDTFPNNGIVFMPETLLVMKGSIPNGTPLILNTDYIVVPKDDSYGKGFIITFILEDGKSLYGADYNIYYKTSFDPDNPNLIENNTIVNKQKRYINQAVFTGTTFYQNVTTNINETRTVHYDINETSTNNGKKIGNIRRDVREIDWEIYVNYLSKEFTEFKVTDSLSEGQEFIYKDEEFKKNFAVKKYSIDKNGNISVENTVLDPSNYIVEKTGNGFELTFIGGIEDPFLIEFTTKIVGVSNQKYTNNAEVTGGQKYNAEVTHTNHANFLEKGSNAKGTNVFTDDEISWTLTLNKSLSEILADAVLTDTISSGHEYLIGSLVIKDSADNELVLGKDYTLLLEDVTDGELLTITFNNSINQIYTVNYKTVVTGATGTSITNRVSFQGQEETVHDNDNKSYRIIQLSGGTGQGEDRGKIKITKLNEDNNPITHSETKFELYYELNGNYRRVEDTEFSTVNGVLEFINLPLRTYYLREVEAPTGYELAYEWDGNELPAPENWPEELVIDVKQTAKEYEFAIGVINKKIKIDITAEKVWKDGPKPTIWFKLYRHVDEGTPVEVPNTDIKELSNGNTEVTWEDVDLTDNDGNEYTYTVKEVDEKGNDFTPENYNKTEEGLIVTNTYTIPQTDVTAIKVWEDGLATKPTIWFKLYRNILNGSIEGVPNVAVKELPNGITKVEWTELDRTDINGNEYIFTVKEVDVESKDFTPVNHVKAENGLVVTNSYVSPTDAYAKATKVWVNGPQSRPTVWFKLYRQVEGGDLEEVPEDEAPIIKLQSGTTEVVWNKLTKTDKAGNVYTFSVKEVDAQGNELKLENYTKSEDGLTIKNTYVIPKTEVTGTKEWKGGPSKKPTIELQLYQDGVLYGDPIILADGETSYTWTELDETDINGKKHVYTIDEIRVPSGYRKTITNDGITVTNTVIPDEPSDPEGRIRIIKKDSDTRELLSGAEFDIIDSRGRVVDTLTTNSRGEATSKYLPTGRYTIEETKAPKGYILDAEEIDVRITDGRTVEVVVNNDREDGPEKPTKPTDPTDPNKPVDPDKPTDPEKPGEPTEPGKPEEPGKPTDPDKPEEPGTPVEPEEPGGPSAPGDEFEDVDGENPQGTGKPENKPTLPKTGYDIEIGFLMLGLLLLTFGFLLRIKRRV